MMILPISARRELLYQGVCRLCHHHARSPGRRLLWWWIVTLVQPCTQSQSVCLMSTYSLMMTRRKVWQSRSTSGNNIDLVNVHIPPASSCPWNYAPDFDALLEDRGNQMVLGNLNANYPSWFSRTGDDRAAARGEALDRAINSSQLAVAKQDLPTRFPSQGQPSSPDITLLSRHLLPDAIWSTMDNYRYGLTSTLELPLLEGQCYFS